MAPNLWGSPQAGEPAVGTGADLPLRKHARQVALSLADPLDFHRHGVDRLLHPREAVEHLLRDCAHHLRAPAPDAPRPGDGQDERGGNEDESRDHPELLGRARFTGARRRRLDRARNRGLRGHGLVGLRDLLVESDDARVDLREACLESAADGGLPRVRGVQLPSDRLALVLQLVELVAEHVPLVSQRLIHRAR
jgi:hypothetical protein